LSTFLVFLLFIIHSSTIAGYISKIWNLKKFYEDLAKKKLAESSYFLNPDDIKKNFVLME